MNGFQRCYIQNACKRALYLYLIKTQEMNSCPSLREPHLLMILFILFTFFTTICMGKLIASINHFHIQLSKLLPN